MRLLDGLITRLLDGPLSAAVTARVDAALDARLDARLAAVLDARLATLVDERVDEQVEALKLDALYRHRWHGDASRLRIHETAVVNNALFNVSGGTVTVGRYAFFGHDVACLTGTHDIEQFGLDRQLGFPRSGRDVVIGDGVWLASHVLVLGPVTIGEHAVVAAGSLVREDVAPYTVVAGRPARVVKTITARPDGVAAASTDDAVQGGARTPQDGAR
jgi:acetyltransferase-like isoleucine patch superfamily enzyme